MEDYNVQTIRDIVTPTVFEYDKHQRFASISNTKELRYVLGNDNLFGLIEAESLYGAISVNYINKLLDGLGPERFHATNMFMNAFLSYGERHGLDSDITEHYATCWSLDDDLEINRSLINMKDLFKDFIDGTTKPNKPMYDFYGKIKFDNQTLNDEEFSPYLQEIVNTTNHTALELKGMYYDYVIQEKKDKFIRDNPIYGELPFNETSFNDDAIGEYEELAYEIDSKYDIFGDYIRDRPEPSIISLNTNYMIRHYKEPKNIREYMSEEEYKDFKYKSMVTSQTNPYSILNNFIEFDDTIGSNNVRVRLVFDLNAMHMVFFTLDGYIVGYYDNNKEDGIKSILEYPNEDFFNDSISKPIESISLPHWINRADDMASWFTFVSTIPRGDREINSITEEDVVKLFNAQEIEKEIIEVPIIEETINIETPTLKDEDMKNGTKTNNFENAVIGALKEMENNEDFAGKDPKYSIDGIVDALNNITQAEKENDMKVKKLDGTIYELPTKKEEVTPPKEVVAKEEVVVTKKEPVKSPDINNGYEQELKDIKERHLNRLREKANETIEEDKVIEEDKTTSKKTKDEDALIKENGKVDNARLLKIITTNSVMFKELLQTNETVLELTGIMSDNSDEIVKEQELINKRLDGIESKLDKIIDSLETRPTKEESIPKPDLKEMVNERNTTKELHTGSNPTVEFDNLDEDVPGQDYSYAELGQELLARFASDDVITDGSTFDNDYAVECKSIDNVMVDNTLILMIGGKINKKYECRITNGDNKIMTNYVTNNDGVIKPLTGIVKDTNSDLLFAVSNGYIMGWSRKGEKFRNILDNSTYPYNGKGGIMNSIGIAGGDYLGDLAEYLYELNSTHAVKINRGVAVKLFETLFFKSKEDIAKMSKHDVVFNTDMQEEISNQNTIINTPKQIEEVEEVEEVKEPVASKDKVYVDKYGMSYTVGVDQVGEDVFFDTDNFTCKSIILPSGDKLYVGSVVSGSRPTISNENTFNNYENVTVAEPVDSFSNQEPILMFGNGNDQSTMPNFNQNQQVYFGNQQQFNEYAFTVDGFGIGVSDDPSKNDETIQGINNVINQFRSQGDMQTVNRLLCMCATITLDVAQRATVTQIEPHLNNLAVSCGKLLTNRGYTLDQFQNMSNNYKALFPKPKYTAKKLN